MKQRCEQLYRSLLKDIDDCSQKYSCLQDQIEHSFVICNRYLAIIRQEAESYVFKTSADEIYFFRQIKPLFTAEVEYYGFYYHAQLFKAGISDPVKIEQFWIREATRLEKFIAENRDFYEYYKQSRTDKDAECFIRHTNKDTNYDPLVSTLLALERYHEYVQTEM
jgi:hypothetical protein